MTVDYALLKTFHILSATLLFGTGIGSAFHMWMTHLRGDVRAIAVVARNVVLADWLFTATSGVAQPITGFAMIWQAGFDPLASWLIVAYGLYIVAGACWLPVVLIQIHVARIAARCAAEGRPLPPEYRTYMRRWFVLGWPAFVGLLAVFWLMVAKPDLW